MFFLTIPLLSYDNYGPFSHTSLRFPYQLAFHFANSTPGPSGSQVLIAQRLTPEQQMIFESSTLKHRRALFARAILRPVAALAEPEDCAICYEAMELSLGGDDGPLTSGSSLVDVFSRVDAC